MTTIPWLAGMALSAALEFIREPRVRGDRRAARRLTRHIITAAVIGLGIMELWRSHIKTPLIAGPGSLLPHTSVAAFVLGYFCNSVADRVLEVWRKR